MDDAARRSISAGSSSTAPAPQMSAAKARIDPSRTRARSIDARCAQLYKVNIDDNTWSRRATAGFNIASPISARCFRRAARSSPCSTSRMSTWTSICRPRKPAGSRSAPMRASCSTPIPNAPIPAKVSFIAEPGAIHAEDGRNPERARQADVPHPGADRSRSLARARRRRCAADCPASPTCAPIRRSSGPTTCKATP